jgi:predicted nuclease of predicted toxin-antitoxin system
LLFDENLSDRLVARLADIFPGSTSTEALGLRSTPDGSIWTAAVERGLAIVTRDDDFVDLSALRGHPPKIIFIALGNCSTGQVESLLRWRAEHIRRFMASEDLSCLELR